MRFKVPEGTKCVICGDAFFSRRLCRRCYAREWARGNIAAFPPYSLDEILEMSIQRTETCWLWMKGRASDGYGYIHVDGKRVQAHRLMYERVNGPIPDGLLVRHTCDNPPCVNPAHLLLGTYKDNAQDAVQRDRNSKGSRNGRANFTEEQVLAIRADARSLDVIAAEYGVSKFAIHAVQIGKSWKHLPGARDVKEMAGNTWAAKLTEEQAQAILDDPRTSQEIATALGLKYAMVWNIKQRHTWKHLEPST